MCYKAGVTELPPKIDVAIVGGWFAGMSTACWLARRAVRDVIVLEREAEMGLYESGRRDWLGRQLAEDDLISALTVAGAAQLRAQFPHAWTETGGILTFDTIDHARDYAARAERLGVTAKRMSRDAVLVHWPQLAAVQIEAALHVPSDGLIDVAALLAGFASDARIAASTGVERVEPAAAGARIVTSRGPLEARVVVDATGAWAGRTTGDTALDSYKRHVYVLEAVAPTGAPFVWHLGACELYVRAAGGRVMVSPCDATRTPAGDQQPDLDGESLLRERLADSPLASAPLARAWACQRTFPRLPPMRLERDRERPWLVWATGLGGHGATASAAVGEAVSALVVAALESPRG